MPETSKFISGEFSRTIDDRYRLSLPEEFKEVFKPEAGKCVIVKENPGHLSLWEESIWKQQFDSRIEMVRQRYETGYLAGNMHELQRFGRLLSTRYRHIQLTERARFLLPEGFREFLGVEPKQEVMIVGAWHCIEIWNQQKWISCIEGDIQQFGNLMESLLNTRTT